MKIAGETVNCRCVFRLELRMKNILSFTSIINGTPYDICCLFNIKHRRCWTQYKNCHLFNSLLLENFLILVSPVMSVLFAWSLFVVCHISLPVFDLFHISDNMILFVRFGLNLNQIRLWRKS